MGEAQATTGLSLAAGVMAYREMQRRLCPLDYWSTSSEPQEYALTRLFAGDWLYINAANRSGKTECVAAGVLAMLQGREWITGENGVRIPVPLIEPPALWILGGASYKALSIGAIDTIRKLLGNGGEEVYTEEHAGNPDSVSLFRIRHRKSRNKSEWSKLYVFPYEGELPEGPGIDGWWCNEPPPIRFLQALKNRKRAGRIMRRAIDATPRDRSKWGPIRAMFPAENRRVIEGRVRVQWPVCTWKNGVIVPFNRALSKADVMQLWADNHDDPQAKAILEGDHIDVEGKCPFDSEVLESSLREAKGGESFGVILAMDEHENEVYRFKRHAKGNVETWSTDRKGKRFICASDPSSGIYDFDLPKDRQVRNPSCMNVVCEDSGEQVARFNGYVTPSELGIVSRAVCEFYSTADDDCLWIPEMNGGWGDEMLRAFGPDYSNIWQETRRSKSSGKTSKSLGWTQTEVRRGLIFGSLQGALADGSLTLRSPESIRNLSEVKFDRNDRLDQGDGTGAHAEDAITLGMIVYAMSRPREEKRRKEPKTGREAAEESLGIVRNGVEYGEYERDDSRSRKRWA